MSNTNKIAQPVTSQDIKVSEVQNTNIQDLLVEIGLEELPPKNLENFANVFGHNLEKACKHLNLTFLSIETFIAPRRLAAIINGLNTTQPEQTIMKRGPSKAAAFDNRGKPTQAALGFATACQTSLENIGFQETEKGTVLVFEQKMQGQRTEDLIPKIVQDALHALPIAKRMRWGELNDTFVRPVHWIVLLFGNTLIKTDLFGIQSEAATRGHRFHHPEGIQLSKPSDYESQLFIKGKVIANHAKRRQFIEDKLNETAAKLKAKALIDPELLDQVTGLVEWPVLLSGHFSKDFLKLPREVLISSMQVHQKCFPLMNDSGELIDQFLIVSNIESSNPQVVIEGNERVMQARLHDAVFYYRVDQDNTLQQKAEGLKQVIFQHGLGTLWDKAERINKLGQSIAKALAFDAKQLYFSERVSMLCKVDLLTQMVLEFPELQGIMGRHYALHDGETAAVAEAIEEHYHPRFAQDSLPASLLGAVIAIADRIDSLVGIFGLGKRSTGDKDPFALRRQTMAVLRILIEQKIDLDLKVLFKQAKENYGSLLKVKEDSLIAELLDFSFERLRAWYLEQNIPARVFDAVLVKQITKPLDFHDRLQAVTSFLKLSEAESLSAANKRVRNILEKNEHSLPNDDQFDECLLKEDTEKTLVKILQVKEAEIKPLIKLGNYTEALKTLAALKEPIDNFFDNVMVMVEEVALRDNRLKLLKRLRALFLEIADISVL